MLGLSYGLYEPQANPHVQLQRAVKMHACVCCSPRACWACLMGGMSRRLTHMHSYMCIYILMLQQLLQTVQLDVRPSSLQYSNTLVSG
jgi:hypothetical protein